MPDRKPNGIRDMFGGTSRCLERRQSVVQRPFHPGRFGRLVEERTPSSRTALHFDGFLGCAALGVFNNHDIPQLGNKDDQHCSHAGYGNDSDLEHVWQKESELGGLLHHYKQECPYSSLADCPPSWPRLESQEPSSQTATARQASPSRSLGTRLVTPSPCSTATVPPKAARR